ncbi:hypothetical protein pipiens_009634, partial [Culex pipiens pipiens]
MEHCEAGNICLEEPACAADVPEVPCGGVCDDDGVPCDFVVPESGCCNPCVPSASEPAMAECCGGSPASATVPRQRSQGFIQQQCHNCSCGRPDCVPTKKVRYVQPARRQTCKPVSCYKAPEVEFQGDSVYKTSYPGDGATNARPLPISPRNNLSMAPGNLEKNTVTSLSYPCYHTVERQKPILPTTNQIIISAGPIQEVTTTAPDYAQTTLAGRARSARGHTQRERPVRKANRQQAVVRLPQHDALYAGAVLQADPGVRAAGNSYGLGHDTEAQLSRGVSRAEGGLPVGTSSGISTAGGFNG